MRHVTYNLRLDVRRSGSQASIRVRQGEQRSRKMHVSLTNGGTPMDYDWLDSAVLRALKPDGTVLFDDCTLDGSTIAYEFTEQLEAVEGEVNCELLLYASSGAILYSPKFSVYVEGALYDNGKITSKDEFTTLVNALGTLNQVMASEEDREEAEQARVDAEDARVDSEDARVLAEQSREEAEQVREAKLSKIAVTAETVQTGAPARASISMTAEDGISLALGLPRGEKGETGKAFQLLDYYATAEELYAAVPNPEPGDAYGVGTDPVEAYVYGATTGWKNYGTITGPAGDDGAAGPYFYPTLDADGNLSWWNNGGLDNPDPVNIRGPQGDQGTQGIQGEKGEKGDKGDKGDQGEKGEAATLPDWVGNKKPSYSASEISLSDTGEHYTGSNVEAALEEAAVARAALDTAKAAKSEILTGTLLASNWSGEEGPYTQTVYIDGITASTNAEIDFVHSSDKETELANLEAYSKINFVTEIEGGFTATCMEEAPTVDLAMRVLIIH